ncbi:hypothetical protein [Nonomuraea sp. NPDC003709]|uniref:hypothetical protein n=1 Tax=Nonomuraea sp. NPDC003709 TaxID=3154450 RepID=UPI0033BE19CC
MRKRALLPIALTAAAVLGQAVPAQAVDLPYQNRTGVGMPVPARDQAVSPQRMRELAVAFVQPSADNLDASLDKMAEAGVRRAQIVASWTGICQKRDECDWSKLDAYFAKAAKRGISTAVHINSTPDWVHPDLVDTVENYGERIWYPPTRTPEELAEFEKFVTTLASRYRGKVESYEIWNEENWRDFYKPVEDPADYAKLLRSGYLSVKAADPRAKVIFGGTTRTDPGFVREVYAAVRKYPDAVQSRHFFDLMGAHPYTDDRHPDDHDPGKVRENAAGGEFDDNFLGIDRLYSEMVRQGDADKQIYLGEFSYSSVRTWMGLVPDDRRAFYLRRVMELTAQRPYVSGLSWFVWSETRPEDEWRGWTLLEYPDKPTRTYLELAELTGASPTERAPRLMLGDGTASVDRLPSNVERVELYLEGVRAASGTSFPLTFTPPARGTTQLAQAVLYTGDGRTIQTTTAWLSAGRPAVQVSHPKVKATRNVDVTAGLKVTGPVLLRVIDASGDVVMTMPLGVGTGRQTRFDALVALDDPGTYQLSVHDPRGRRLADPALLEVVQ